MLVEKEIIRPGTYWYVDEKTGLPKKLVVTSELTKHWHDQGNAMLSAGLPVPVPYEHDFSAHPMTPKDKLLNNAGEVKQYTLKGSKGDVLFSTVDVQDPDVKNKIGHSIRWTSPWFSSFTDGDGKEWKNVISHLALTTRPRVTKQEPFSSISAALSMATEVKLDASSTLDAGAGGFCLSRAGRLLADDSAGKCLRPKYPLAFSLWGGGIKLSEGDVPPKKGSAGAAPTSKKAPPTSGDKPAGGGPPDGKVPPKADSADSTVDSSNDKAGEFGDSEGDDSDDSGDGLTNPLADASGDVKMEEILCDLLQSLGVPMPDDSNPTEFKRHLYEAAMCKIKELTAAGNPNSPQNTAKAKIPGAAGQNPNQPARPGMNPLIQQEQPPMYMSLEEINKIADDTMRTIALSMYNENVKLRAEMESAKKTTDSLRDAKLKEASAARDSRVSLLSRLSPRVKADLDAMLAVPSMALSMGDGGAVVDPMAQTLAVLEKGLADLPRLLTTDSSALSVVPQPTDSDAMTDARADEIADGLARQMGCTPRKQAG